LFIIRLFQIHSTTLFPELKKQHLMLEFRKRVT
jgi:hypothetical protein